MGCTWLMTARLRGLLSLVSCAYLLCTATSASAQSPTFEVSIESDPPGATIRCPSGDCDFEQAKTPYRGRLASGSYTVVFELDGYTSETKDFKVGKRRTRVAARLERFEPAFLRITVEPKGAEDVEVKVDEGKHKPLNSKLLVAPGPH